MSNSNNVIKDSGERTEFSSGAVRDMHEGKGRCDLMPLREVSDLLEGDIIVHHICLGVDLRDPGEFVSAAAYFIDVNEKWKGAADALLDVAKHYEQGCLKYGERNWEKGIPLHSFVDSGLRHYLKWLRGDDDEPHDRAFVWNMFGASWTMRNRCDLVDMPVST